jgi:hypothetical protein
MAMTAGEVVVERLPGFRGHGGKLGSALWKRLGRDVQDDLRLVPRPATTYR